MNQDTLDRVSAVLKHPFRGLRKTDPQLAQAALTGTLGRRRHLGAEQSSSHGSLTDGLVERNLPARRHGRNRVWEFRGLLAKLQRRWRLYRALQVDQGQTPWCVDATRCHWQLALPTYGRLTHPLGDLYTECKKIDPWPGQDGTSAEYMLQICERLGIVASSWWWVGPEDNEAALRWLTEVGGLWFGSMWPEAAFRTRFIGDRYDTTDGLVEVPADVQWLYGHEVFIIGRNRNFKGLGPALELVQSWGRFSYGVDGRFWILERDFFDHWMHPDRGWGDLVGVVEQPAP